MNTQSWRLPQTLHSTRSSNPCQSGRGLVPLDSKAPPVPSGLEPEQALGIKTEAMALPGNAHSPVERDGRCQQIYGSVDTGWGREGGRAGHEFREGFPEEVRPVRRLCLEDEGPEGLRGAAGVRKRTIIWRPGCQRPQVID